jgi:catechol 2,3-dioxygenase-like lactoylglutathione lyase family enzyme
VALDHVVALTDDLERSLATLRSAGLEPRRVRRVPGSPVRQAFYALGPALLELAGPVEGRHGTGFWGLTIAVRDLDALAGRLGDRLGPVRDAVQPGRRIATLRPTAGLATAVAFMTPR